MSTLRVGTIANAAGSQSTSAENVINGSAKAWVNFNGTGTVAIRGSYNVTSITDNGVGDYTVNFTNAMPDANYCVTASCSQRNSDNFISILVKTEATAPTSSAVRVRAYSTNGTLGDYPYNDVAIFR